MMSSRWAPGVALVAAVAYSGGSIATSSLITISHSSRENQVDTRTYNKYNYKVVDLRATSGRKRRSIKLE
jgi:hypothetical protein